ncbi:hypothetical protein [Nocardia lasii]|uniref:DUF3558 domain-containing protein n=1 Tax=Nocardia lasii TaxID=1616107 RepID=A0ABW1JTF9_9NOCA
MTYPSGQQGPGGWGQPTYQPAQYAQEIPPLGPPSKKSNAGWIVVALIAVAGLVAGVGLLVSAGRDGVAGTAVAASPTLTPATTSASPTTTTKPKSAAASRFTYTDYEGPWDFQLGDVQMHADWADGRDHASCTPVEKGGKLTDLGCQYSTEMWLTAEAGAVKLTQFVLAMPDAATAETAADKIEEKDLNVRPGGIITDFETGKWKASSSKEFIIVTLVTATAAVEAALVEKYLRYRHGDTAGAIAFR